MHLVQYVATAPHLLRSGSAALLVREATIQCAVDKTQLDQRMFEILATLGTTITKALIPRTTPSATPWGQLRLPRVDADSPGLLTPVLSPGGIVIPLPRQLITEDLARTLAVLGSGVLRLYEPPPLGDPGGIYRATR